MQNYRIYEHIYGMPEWADTVLEELEDYCSENKISADQAEKFIKQYVSNVDKYGRKRNVYVYKINKEV